MKYLLFGKGRNIVNAKRRLFQTEQTTSVGGAGGGGSSLQTLHRTREPCVTRTEQPSHRAFHLHFPDDC